MSLLGEFGGTEELANEPPINWLLEGWLPARELSVLYGAPGTFKSFIAQGWSCQLAKLGWRTMYIAAEGISGLRPRIEAWRAKNLQDQTHHLRMWHYYNSNVWLDEDKHRQVWVDGLVDFLNPGVRDRAAREVAAHSQVKTPDLIIIDTLARNFLGDENSAKEMGLFVDGIERIRRTLDTAVLVVHHTVKGKARTERGTEALRAASFAMFRTSEPTGRPKRGGGSVLLECDRMKDGEPPNEVRVDFDRVDLDADKFGQVYRYSLAMGQFPPKENLPKVSKSPGNNRKTNTKRERVS